MNYSKMWTNRCFALILEVLITITTFLVVKHLGIDHFKHKFRINCMEKTLHKIGENERVIVINNMMRADDKQNKEDISLLVQGDISKLHYVPQLAQLWEGPIEAVFYHTNYADLDRVVSAIIQLRYCFSHIRKHVTWHFVSPSQNDEVCKEEVNIAPHLSFCDDGDSACENHESSFEFFFAKLRNNLTDPGLDVNYWFPVNVLRNVARNNTKTDWHLTLDIDLVVSESMRERFLNFAKRNGVFNSLSKPIYILPGFEFTSDSDDLPRTMEELFYHYYITMGLRVFHEWCKTCYHHTNYELWLKSCQNQQLKGKTDIIVSHYVQWKSSFEPYIIAPNTIPMFPEQFQGYGYNKISQSYETALAGYKFAVLANAFVVHHGWKSPTEGIKKLQLKHNSIIWEKLKRKLHKQYSNRLI